MTYQADAYLGFVNLTRFSIECHKPKTKVITTANHYKGKHQKEPMRTQNKHNVNGIKCGKTRMTKSLLVLVLHLID